MTMYAYCGETEPHPQHAFHRNAVRYGCSGTLSYSDRPFADEPEFEVHQSPKGVQWDQFQLFDPADIAAPGDCDIEEETNPNLERARELAAWWMEQARTETRSLVPKAISYGSVDLDVMGEAMLRLMPQLRGVVPAQEVALAFYLMGKVARIIGAYERGVRPTDDSWMDARIYAGMALRVRERGYW